MARGGDKKEVSNKKRAKRLNKTFATIGGAERHLEKSPLKGFVEIVRKGNRFGFKFN